MTGEAPRSSSPTDAATAMTTACINLREHFGAQFKIGYDPAAVTPGEKSDPWLMTMPCKYGLIYPFAADGRTLALELDGHPAALKKLLALPGVRIHQDGDRETTLLFDVSMFDRVAEVVRPRKRRRLPEAQRQACAERLAAFSFRPRTSGRKTDPQTAPQDPG
jgi:hypothetical protein